MHPPLSVKIQLPTEAGKGDFEKMAGQRPCAIRTPQRGVPAISP